MNNNFWDKIREIKKEIPTILKNNDEEDFWHQVGEDTDLHFCVVDENAHGVVWEIAAYPIVPDEANPGKVKTDTSFGIVIFGEWI